MPKTDKEKVKALTKLVKELFPKGLETIDNGDGTHTVTARAMPMTISEESRRTLAATHYTMTEDEYQQILET